MPDNIIVNTINYCYRYRQCQQYFVVARVLGIGIAIGIVILMMRSMKILNIQNILNIMKILKIMKITICRLWRVWRGWKPLSIILSLWKVLLWLSYLCMYVYIYIYISYDVVKKMSLNVSYEKVDGSSSQNPNTCTYIYIIINISLRGGRLPKVSLGVFVTLWFVEDIFQIV